MPACTIYVRHSRVYDIRLSFPRVRSGNPGFGLRSLFKVFLDARLDHAGMTISSILSVCQYPPQRN
jgi:hypothetical protein